MKYTNLGNSGLEVSKICFGAMSLGLPNPDFPWVIDFEQSRSLIKNALERGINFFDTANSYSNGSSEKFLGKALSMHANRDEIVIATKAYFPTAGGPNKGGLSRKALIQACEDSLKRLGTDYIDLYQIHRWDDDTPIEETMSTLHSLIQQGKVRYIGASSMLSWQFLAAQHCAERNGFTKFISMQNQLNLIYREEEREMLPLCNAIGVDCIPWSPLARGHLTRAPGASSKRLETDSYGKMYDAQIAAIADGAVSQRDREIVAIVDRIAKQREVSRAQIALAWLHQKPTIAAPVVGISKLRHIQDACNSLDVYLSADEISELEAPYLPHPVIFGGGQDLVKQVTVR